MLCCCIVKTNWAVSKTKTKQEILVHFTYYVEMNFYCIRKRVLKIKVLCILDVCRCVLRHVSVDTFHFFHVSMLQKTSLCLPITKFFWGPVLNLSNIFPLFLWLFEAFLVTEMCSWVQLYIRFNLLWRVLLLQIISQHRPSTSVQAAEEGQTRCFFYPLIIKLKRCYLCLYVLL